MYKELVKTECIYNVSCEIKKRKKKEKEKQMKTFSYPCYSRNIYNDVTVIKLS